MVSPSIPGDIPEEGYSGRATAQVIPRPTRSFVAGRLDLGAVLRPAPDGFHWRNCYDTLRQRRTLSRRRLMTRGRSSRRRRWEHDDGTLENSPENEGGTISAWPLLAINGVWVAYSE